MNPGRRTLKGSDRRAWLGSVLLVCIFGFCAPLLADVSPAKVSIQWKSVLYRSRTNVTLQVVVNPKLRRGSPIHDRAWQALRDLQADYVRFAMWFPYPKLAVAELDPPSNGMTHWDFSLLDPLSQDFFEATDGHSGVMTISTIPQWMFKTGKPVAYPSNADQVAWDYEQGRELRDSSFKEVADYFARVAGWYTRGGFTDEFGQRHESGLHYKIEYWEILNEPEYEHSMGAEAYTRLYDAVASAVHAVSPETKFVGLSLAEPSKDPRFFEYFLEHKNHQPGVRLDMISYHFYAVPGPDEPSDVQPYTFFERADHFLEVVRYIEAMRLRLSPETQTDLNEVGCISADDLAQGAPGRVMKPIPDSYWNLCGAMYAYLFAGAAREGIEVLGASQLVGFPTQFPSVTLVDWNTGQPNARYWVLKLVHDNFGPGDSLVESHCDVPYIFAQGFVTKEGKRKVLLINKRDRAFEIVLPGAGGGHEEHVDQTTGSKPAASTGLTSEKVNLQGLCVMVVTLGQ